MRTQQLAGRVEMLGVNSGLVRIRSWRVLKTITISSSEQLPARSPMPLMVHSICRAPACTAASELATAKPRSSWQWTLTTARIAQRLHHAADQRRVFVRHGVADGVRNVDGAGARGDDGARNLFEIVGIGAGSVFGRKLDVVHVAAAPVRRRPRRLPAPARAFLQLVLQVDVAGGDEGVDAGASGVFQRFRRRARHRACSSAPARLRWPREIRGSPRPRLRNRHPRRWGTRPRGYPRPVRPVCAPCAASRVRSCCIRATVRRRGASYRRYIRDRS